VVGHFTFAIDQRNRLHDLPRLAVSALWDVVFHPGFLHGMQPLGAKAFDRDDRFADGVAGKKLTRSRRGAIDMDRAGAAARDTAAVFGAGEPDAVAQNPKQRGLGLDIHLFGLAVDV